MAINVGRLRHRVKFLRMEEGMPDRHGRRQIAYTPWREVWAQVQDVSGREFFEAAAYHLEKTVTITLRYIPGLRNDMRIQWGETMYEIMEINHLGYVGDYLKIKVKTVQPEEQEESAYGLF